MPAVKKRSSEAAVREIRHWTRGNGPDSGCDELGMDIGLIFEDSFESGDTSAWTLTES